MTSTESLLTVRQVAALLQVPVKSVYALLAPAGDLPCVRTTLGAGVTRKTRGRVRVAQADLEAWLARHRSTPTEATVHQAVTRASVRDLPGASRYVS